MAINPILHKFATIDLGEEHRHEYLENSKIAVKIAALVGVLSLV